MQAKRAWGRQDLSNVAFWVYLVLALVALSYVLLEPMQAAGLVRTVASCVRDLAELVVRSLPKPVPAP